MKKRGNDNDNIIFRFHIFCMQRDREEIDLMSFGLLYMRKKRGYTYSYEGIIKVYSHLTSVLKPTSYNALAFKRAILVGACNDIDLSS